MDIIQQIQNQINRVEGTSPKGVFEDEPIDHYPHPSKEYTMGQRKVTNVTLLMKYVLLNVDVEKILDYIQLNPGEINKTNSLGNTALILACNNHQVKTVAMLIVLKCNLDIQNNDGNNALLCTYQQHNGDLISHMLINNSINIQARNNKRLNVLTEAIENSRLVDTLISKNINITKNDLLSIRERFLRYPTYNKIALSTLILNHYFTCQKLADTKKQFYTQHLSKIPTISKEIIFIPNSTSYTILSYHFKITNNADINVLYLDILENNKFLLNYLSIHNPLNMKTKIIEYIAYH